MNSIYFQLLILIYGITDTITAYFMILKHGISSELNPMVVHIFPEYGLLGMFLMKFAFLLLIFFTIRKFSNWRNIQFGIYYIFLFGGLLGTIGNTIVILN